MKILHVINSLRIGGAEQMVSELIPFLIKKHQSVDVLVIQSRESYLEQKLQHTGVKIWYSPFAQFWNPCNFIFILYLIQKEGYDVVHSHLTYAQLWCSVASVFCRRKVKFITTEHSSFNRRRKLVFFRFFDRCIYSGYDHILSISPSTQSSLLSWLRLSNTVKFEVVPNGVNLEKFDKAVSISRKTWDIPDSAIILMMVGRMAEAKDQDTLIRALALLPQEYILFLVGDGTTRIHLMKLAEQNQVSERVIFTGNRKDVPELLKMANLYIQSSHWEGMPTTLLEAMAAHVPVLGSDVPGIRGLLMDDMMFEHANVQNLARKIVSVNKQQLLKEQQKMISKYDLSNIADQLIDLYPSKR